MDPFSSLKKIIFHKLVLPIFLAISHLWSHIVTGQSVANSMASRHIWTQMGEEWAENYFGEVPWQGEVMCRSWIVTCEVFTITFGQNPPLFILSSDDSLLLLHSLQASLSCPYRLCLTPLLCLHFTYISAHPSFHYNCPLFSLSTVRSLRMRTMSQSPWSPAPSTVLSTFHLLTLYPNYSYCCPPLRERGFFYQQGLSHLCKPKPVVYDQTSRERAYQMLGAVPFHHFLKLFI